MDVLNGISGSVTTEISYIVLSDGKVLDLKFLYDDSLLVLWAAKGKYIPDTCPLKIANSRQTNRCDLSEYHTSPTT